MNEAAKRLQAAIEEKRHSDKYAVTVLVNQPDIKAVLDESTTQAARIAELEARVREVEGLAVESLDRDGTRIAELEEEGQWLRAEMHELVSGIDAVKASQDKGSPAYGTMKESPHYWSGALSSVRYVLDRILRGERVARVQVVAEAKRLGVGK